MDQHTRWEAEIIASHNRSREYGVSPSLRGSPESTRLGRQQLAKRIHAAKPFLELVVAQVDLIRHILEDSSFCMAIADPEGYVLHVIGEGPIMEQFRRRNCLPGYRWQERDVGTCAIGMVLHTQKPVLLHGHQMFNTSAQHITNSAVPVFAPSGNLVCVLSLSGFAEKVHLHTLGMLMQAAQTIRLQMQARDKARQLDLHGRYMDSLVESDHRGIITLDKKGCIVRYNSRAAQLTGLGPESVGMDIDACIASSLSVREYVRRGRHFIDREVVFKGGGGEVKHVASLDPVLQDGKAVGGLLTLLEGHRALRLANAMAGGQAAFTFASIIGASKALREAMDTARSAAKSTAPVLLQGETGTGKELFAQAIHNAGPRARSPFIVINCGAIPRELLESELFGYEEGAFTGAQKGGRPGKLELAHGGTLFLDEIGDMPFDMQVKLLRCLQSGEIQRLGSNRTVRLDLRIITATNADLKSDIANRRFREDLYYRISTIVLKVPPLRERGDDVMLLANAFLDRYGTALGKEGSRFSDEAMQALLTHPWPGNIRELENRVERSVVLCRGPRIRPRDLGLETDNTSVPLPHGRDAIELKMLEKQHIERMLRSGGSLSGIARQLGVSRPTLYRKLRKYGLRE